MFEEIELGSEFFERLTAIDAEITAQVAREGCRFCGGRLHRGDYPRKPRGGLIAGAAESFRRRFSLCCGREGCRRRATPPSVRFLGRRLYVSAVVIVASVIALALTAARAAERATGVPARTTRRWLRWWRGPFVETPVYFELAAQLITVDRRTLPACILHAMRAPPLVRVQSLAEILASWTTASLPDGSRFVRAACRAIASARPAQKMAQA